MNIQNRTIYCKDNLEILRGIDTGCVDMIYLDPPFNSKKQWNAPIGTSAEGASFKDTWSDDDIKHEWVEDIRIEWPDLHQFLKGMKMWSSNSDVGYITYMAIRIIECRRVLKTTGTLFYHCDHVMNDYVKIMLDIIFGREHDINNIVWCYRKMPNNAKSFQKNHDNIFWYCKTKDYQFNKILGEPTAGSKKTFESGKRRGYNANNSKKMVTVFDWDKYNQAVSDGKIPSDLKAKEFTGGKPPEKDWWEDVKVLGGPNNKEKTGYPTQKPLSLLHRIIKASTNEGDLVLDPFCGCATTCIAAEQLGRDWVGIDVSQKAYELVKLRLEKDVPADLFRGEPNFSTVPPVRGEQDEREKKYVYVISNDAYPDEFKVGIATNIKQRLSSYQTSDPNRAYKMLFNIKTPDYREIEKYIHEKFDNRHEWVRAELDDIVNEIKRYQT